MTGRVRSGWILSPAGDLAVFAGPLVAAAAIVLAFAREGRLEAEVPPWAFVLLVVGCDVAHVWSTLFRTYLDPEERARRPGLLLGVPVLCFAAGVMLHLFGSGVFWTVLAYLAAFHFVRQQYGWMVYAARKGGETSAFDRRLDALFIYSATGVPLLWWHANLPRSFVWFRDGDFLEGLPAAIGTVALGAHWVVNALWVGRQAWRWARGGGVNLAKVLVGTTTWAAWYGGIVWLDSDVAFTATNVLAHGVPYFAIVHRWGRGRWAGSGGRLAAFFRPAGFLAFYGVLLALAFAEEGLWDALVWQQRAELFPLPRLVLDESMLAFVVPLLAVPQATHYLLDAWIWRTGADNPGLAERLGFVPAAPVDAGSAAV
ncbi:MAG TPA: hypothetical protein VFS92_02100 [Planctomycetota bacterium]|nr:hypothetical protein [Planctomycetota bacterium]